MSKDNTLPESMQQEIDSAAGTYVDDNCYAHEEQIGRDAFTAGANKYASTLHLLQQEYDKLKAHDELVVSMLEVLRGEYHQLQGKADAYEKALRSITVASPFMAPSRYMAIAIEALSSYNSQTNNQNENNG